MNKINRVNISRNALASLNKTNLSSVLENQQAVAQATTGLTSNQNLYIDSQEKTINLSGIVNQHVKLEKYSFNIEPVPASFAAQLDFKPTKIISITIQTENDMSYYSEAMNAERTEKCEMLKSELSQLALVLESNQVFAEPINPVTGEYLIRNVPLDTPICESDPRLGHLEKFSIEDVGCCTVLKHIEFGTKCVSGFLFVA